MLLVARVRHSGTWDITTIRSERHSTKKSFMIELSRSGHSIIEVSNRRDLQAKRYGYNSFADMMSNCLNIELVQEVQKVPL